MKDAKKIAELIQEQQSLGKSSLDIAEHLVANGATIPVRCKNCVYFWPSVDLCLKWEIVTGSDGFCHSGALRGPEQRKE